jgi:hypothetical protein
MKVGVASPHVDDAIFSIAAHLMTLDGEISIVTPMAGVPADEPGRRKHTTLRREHDVACAAIGANAVNGDWLDDVYPAPARPDVSEWLADQLLDLDEVYINLGIFHPDHLLTSNLLIDLIRITPSLPYRIYFYEELPYRVDYPKRAESRIEYIENRIGRLKLIEQAPTEAKKIAVQMYRSQVDEALLVRLLVNERIWELVR